MKSFAKYFIVLASLTALIRAEPALLAGSNGKQYLVEADQAFTWFEAKRNCQQQNMQLVEIYSQEQQTEMEAVLKPLHPESIDLWLGATDEFSTSTEYTRPMYWSTSGNLMGYSNWTPKNPNNQDSKEHCIHIWKAHQTFAWNDIPCTTKMGYICETNYVALEQCQNLAAKQKDISTIISSAGESFIQTQNKLSENLNSGVMASLEAERSVCASFVQAQDALVQQITTLLTDNKMFMTTAMQQSENIRTMTPGLIKSSVDESTNTVSSVLEGSKQNIEALLQCGAPLAP